MAMSTPSVCSKTYSSLANFLLELDLSTGRFQSLLDRLGFFDRDVFLDRLRSRIHKILGLFEPARRDATDLFDDLDLVGAGVLQDDGHRGLLFSGSGCPCPGSGGGHHDGRA